MGLTLMVVSLAKNYSLTKAKRKYIFEVIQEKNLLHVDIALMPVQIKKIWKDTFLKFIMKF